MDPESEPNPIPPEPEPPGTGHIFDLSDELLLKIVSYLGQPPTITDDLVNLSQSCPRFDNLLQDASFCRRVKVLWNIYVERCHLVKYLTQPVLAEIMTELNLNDLYWIPSEEIKDLVLKLSNLKGLHVLGTLLNFGELKQILLKLSLSDLSWSWNRNGNGSGPGDTTGTGPTQSISEELSQKLSQLRKLCLFLEDVQYPPPAHLSVCYFLSLCVGLEKLWIFGTDNKFKHSFDGPSGAEEFLEETQFPRLMDFVYLFPDNVHPGFYAPKLVSRILQGFIVAEILEPENEPEESPVPVPVPQPIKPKQLWIEHPYVQYHCKDANPDNFNRAGWPQMDLSNLESLSLPVFSEVLNGLFPNKVVPDLSKLKHLQIFHSSEEHVNLNGYFDSAVNLESFLSKAEGYRMNWYKFVELHPKLTLVNVCYDKNLTTSLYLYTALSKLSKLKRLSVPGSALMGISQRMREIGILLALLWVTSDSTREPTGLNFLTRSCRDVEEFELGLEGKPQFEFFNPFTSNSLASIALWTNLKKLTLNLGEICDGDFMIEIAKSCPLETFRLTIEGRECTEFDFEKGLYEALMFCQHLKDFRLQTDEIGHHQQLIQALQSCKKLERVVIISNHNGILDASIHGAVVKLMEICTRLFVLYLFMNNASKPACRSLQMELESKFKSSRPPLSVVVKNVVKQPLGEFEYPSIHYRQMLVFSTQVDPHFDCPDTFV